METIEVLVADDSNLILKIIKKALLENKIDNYSFEESKIHFAQNGMEAFEMMGKNKNISMLISDINMPFLNGDDLVDVLIDTKLHNKILTIFITANESIIKHSTKKHTIGTIKKPFNYLSFSEYLNELLYQYHENKALMLKQKSKQIAQVTQALQTIVQNYAIEDKIKKEHLKTILNIYFGEMHVIDDDEIEFVFCSIVDELFQVSNIDLNLSQNDLKFVLSEASHKQHRYMLFLKESITSSIESCKELLNEKKEIKYQLILEELITPIHEKALIVRNKFIHYNPKNYAQINSYIEHVLSFFEQIDYAVKDEYLHELLAYKKDIEEFSEWINDYCAQNKLVEEIPQFKNLSKLLKEVYDKYASAARNLNRMQNYIIGEIEIHLFYKALNSPIISTYLKKHMLQVSPNMSNILLHIEKIDRAEHKKLAESDFHTLLVLSNNIDFLRDFKEEYEPICLNTKIFCFSKASLFENWININRVDKLLIDYDFSTSVFDSGMVYLKYFLKQNSKNKALASLIKYNRYYMVASGDIILKEKENFHNISAHIIEKPLCKESVRNILTYS